MPTDRSEESGVRSQESEVRSQEYITAHCPLLTVSELHNFSALSRPAYLLTSLSRAPHRALVCESCHRVSCLKKRRRGCNGCADDPSRFERLCLGSLAYLEVLRRRFRWL